MTQTATRNGKTKADEAKTAGAFDPAFDAFKAFPGFDVPAFRDFAEKGGEQAREAFARIRDVAEDAMRGYEASYKSVREQGLAAGLKALEATKANADASFALVRDLFGAKSFAEAVELQTEFARKQFEVMSGQVRELQAIGEKAAAEATKPVRVAAEKAMKDFKVA
ncbi:MAG: phasin [Bauldia sp.]